MIFSTLLAGSIACCTFTDVPFQRPDTSFDISVSKKICTSRCPVMLIDEGHQNFHTAGGLYAPFASLASNAGVRVVPLPVKINASVLKGAHILVIANASGEGMFGEGPAFDENETNAIRDWVSGGGSLLLVADHFPFGRSVHNLAVVFGIDMHTGLAEDSLNADPTLKTNSVLVFSKENKLLAEHAITKNIKKVISFSGQSLYCKNAVSFLNLSPSARDLKAKIRMTKKNGALDPELTYGEAQPAAGRSMGLALKYGKGRVVALGEAAMLTAQISYDGKHVGMNYNPENKTLVLNILSWLSARE